jgi:PAS domain S-box-containing protein
MHLSTRLLEWLTTLKNTSLLLVRCSKAAILVVFACWFLFQVIAGAQVKETRRVLILTDLGITASPGFGEVEQALWAGLQKSPYHIELYQESLELTLFPDELHQGWFRKEFIRKYSDRKPDVVITAGSGSLKFVAESNESFLRDSPIVFCAIIGQIPDGLRPDMHFTGVLARLRPEETLGAALHLLPSTKHVVVTGGMGESDQGWEAIAKQSFHNYESKLDFTYLTNLSMPALLERLRNLPKDTIVYHTAITQDASGDHFIDSADAVPLVASAANAPVFVMDDVDLRGGTVGGDLVNWADDARVASEMAVRVLNGEKPQNIPVVTSGDAYVFDWRALKRWGLKESELPPGSRILYRQPTMWDSYKWYIIGATSLLLLETVLIVGLLWQRQRRRKAETELAFTYDGLRLAVETGRAVGWDWDVKKQRDRWFGDLETMFGIPSDTYSGDASEFRRRVHPDDQELVWSAIDMARQNRKAYVAEFRVIRNDGAVRWITAAGKFYYGKDGEAERMLGMAVDITERKRVEVSLSGISRKLVQAQEQERSRIARELHDDVNQRLAMLAVELESLQAIRPDLPSEVRLRLQDLRKQTTELSTDVQALSHDLHTSKLEYLGVVAAMKSWCKEFGERQKLDVSFKENVSKALPPELGLPLFRVLQESVHNAAKHSGAREISVQMIQDWDEIQLIVRDSGRGFDTEVAKNGQGLGLISMQERVRLVNGTLVIQSKPMGGTTVYVHVPLESGHEVQQAAG